MHFARGELRKCVELLRELPEYDKGVQEAIKYSDTERSRREENEATNNSSHLRLASLEHHRVSAGPHDQEQELFSPSRPVVWCCMCHSRGA